MAQAAEHAFNTPFFTGSVLVTPKLFTTYRAMNDLSFSKDVQVKVLYASAHTKMYTPLSRFLLLNSYQIMKAYSTYQAYTK
jgi:hypothetical protein